MAHAFKVISASPTFQKTQLLNYASDYLSDKKARLLQFQPKKTNYTKNYDYESFYLLNKRIFHNEFNKFNKANLLYNLYSKENLNQVTIVSSNPANIKVNTINSGLKPFYQNYILDPKGRLFGNSQCGELNFTRYMEPDFLQKE